MKTLLFALAVLSLHVHASTTCEDATGGMYNFEGFRTPLHNLEVVPDGEQDMIEDTMKEHARFFRKTYDQGKLKDAASGLVTTGSRRGVHPKAHGGLVGTLTVNADIAEADRIGLFKDPGRSYPIIARFSNGNPYPNGNDNVADSRGFAFRVQGVDGEPILPGLPGQEEHGQVFEANSSEAFFADSAETYRRFMGIGLNTPDLGTAAIKHVLTTAMRLQLTLAWRILKAFKGIQGVKATSPFAINYYSISAFQFGQGRNSRLMKYSLQPCEGTWTEPFNAENPNFLRENMIKHITNKSACFRFMIQDHYDGAEIEDLSKPWEESKAPWRELARVEFPVQQLVDDRVTEKWVFNPWETHDFKPVGGINRARLGVYVFSALSRMRSNQ